MGWKCFQFWFGVRLLLALLAHFNWFTAFFWYKCIYFSLWKSYDLLWFWMHFLLCACFPPLRPENFLLVWCNLLIHKYREPQKDFRQIYNQLYNRRFSKSERALQSLEKEEVDDKDDEDSDSDGVKGDNGLSVIPETTTTKENIYPDIAAKPKPKVTIQSPPTGTRLQKDNNEGDSLIEEGGNQGDTLEPEPTEDETKSNASSGVRRVLNKALPGILKRKLNFDEPNADKQSPDDDTKSNKSGNFKLQKLIPNKFQRSVSTEAEKEEAEEEKRRLKQQKRDAKERRKRERRERKEILRRQAAIERQRKIVSDSIELMLQCLRSACSFAILTGNIHKHFMTGPFIPKEQTAFNNPDMLMLFTVTMLLDVFLFWVTTVMTYCRQCRLCCRLGICKFFLWLVILLALMFGVMFRPMHFVHEQLDYTWCHFMPGSDLENYLDG
uniref:Uncharacterized protein n=2 Tax=Panagrellus redivivus TaxID=6233 RepID=A0A7E4UT27_PANRE